MTQAERHALTLQTLLLLEQRKNERLLKRIEGLRKSRRMWQAEYRRDIACLQRQVRDAESVAAWWKRSAAGVSSKAARRAASTVGKPLEKSRRADTSALESVSASQPIKDGA